MSEAPSPAPPGPPGPPAPPEQHPWQRLDRRMLLVHPVREVGRFLPVLLGLLLAGSFSGLGGLQLAGVAVPILLGILRWVTTTYRVTGGRVELRRGLLSRRVLSVPLDRVRTVDLTSPAVHRLVGVTILRIGTGAASTDDDLDLDGLDAAVARDLRARLLSASDRAVDPPSEDDAASAGSPGVPGSPSPTTPAETVASFSPRWLVYAPLTGSGLVVVAAVAAGVGQVLNTRDVLRELDPDRWSLALPLAVAIVLGVAAVLLLAALVSVVGYLVTNGRFTLTRTRRSWQVSRGLLTQRETELDVERLAGVAVGEPLALRLTGGAHLAAVVTGVDRSERGSSVLVPPAPADVVAHAATRVVGDRAPLEATLVGHGPRATRRRWVRALTPALVASALLVAAVVTGAPGWLLAVVAVLLLGAAGLALDRARGLGHALVGGHLVARSGSLTRRREVLEVDHVIGWTLRATYWQRRAGLTTLVATTAGGSGRVTVPDVPEEVAVALAHAALPRLVEPFLDQPGSPARGHHLAPASVTAPFRGVLTPLVAEGDVVEAGQTLAVIEAVKLEAAITAPHAGTVTRLGVASTREVEGGELVAVLTRVRTG